jgi:hypothetical protein
MSDDLIERLSDSCYLAFDDGTNDFSAAQEAIDRIAQLERDYKEACNEAAECYRKQCIAERKLAKAVKALRSYTSKQKGVLHTADVVLAELEVKE